MTQAPRNEMLARAAQEDQTPQELLTPEQAKRKYNREKKRKERTKQQHEKTASIAASEKEWWAGNRATLKPEELTAMREQDAYIRDILFSMETVVDVLQSDPVLIEIVEDIVKERGTAHLGYIFRSDLPSDWSSCEYWKDAELLQKLYAEAPSLEQFVKFGLLSTLPDWKVVAFLDRAGWSFQKAADLIGYHIDQRGRVSYR
jgi:hypothetical protein